VLVPHIKDRAEESEMHWSSRRKKCCMANMFDMTTKKEKD